MRGKNCEETERLINFSLPLLILFVAHAVNWLGLREE